MYAGPDGRNISQRTNNCLGTNNLRWANAEYDALYDQVRLVTDLESAADLLIQMNDIIIRENACIPLVHRAADKYAISNRLSNENVALGPFEYNYWNIANWVTVE
jgi:peptide/nickel transport system substrate-binding protein